MKRIDLILNEIQLAIEKVDVLAFQNKTVLITGGTGLIGSSLVRFFLKIKHDFDIDINIFATARNPLKVEKLGLTNDVNWIYKGLSLLVPTCSIDYIIHTACPTDSKYFIEHPVETINENILAFNNLISQTQNCLKSMVFLSSMEVYGSCNSDYFISESEFSGIDPTNVRNCYPEVKHILESLSCAFYSEKNSPIKIVRLCQTFGPGVDLADNRVFAQFCRSVVNGEDIILSTKGETKRSYCSIADAIQGIILVLLNGKNGEAYNLASDDSYYSIMDMANLFIQDRKSKIIINETPNNKYLGTIKFGLNTDKIKSIGFSSSDNLKSIVKKMTEYFEAKQ